MDGGTTACRTHCPVHASRSDLKIASCCQCAHRGELEQPQPPPGAAAPAKPRGMQGSGPSPWFGHHQGRCWEPPVLKWGCGKESDASPGAVFPPPCSNPWQFWFSSSSSSPPQPLTLWGAPCPQPVPSPALCQHLWEAVWDEMKVKQSSSLLCEYLLVCSGCLEPSAQPQDLPTWLRWGARAVSPQSPAAPGT